jgi:DNA-binding FadR family transcriptional regulator
MPPAAVAPIQKSPSLVQQVCDRLAASLLEEETAARGTLLAERELAAQLGVSRNVLREAIQRLELQGLVEIRQGHSTRIVHQLHKPLTAALHLKVPEESARLEQLFELRLMIEPHAARLAARRASPEQLAPLQAAQHRLRDAQTLEAAVQADMDFHRALAEASGNRILLLVIESLAELLATAHGRGFRVMPQERPILAHQEILDAILRRDADTAARHMTAHIKNARTEIGLPDNPDLADWPAPASA